MIQAGAIRMGSGCTFSVVGSYWISSTSSLRNTTLPRDVATVSPTTKSPVVTGPSPADTRRTQSLQKFCQPRTKFSPRLSNDRRSTSGLVAAKLEGDITSSICRIENSTIASFCFATPRTPVVALCHHCSPSRKACAIRLNGGCSHSGRPKRLSCGCGSISAHGPLPGRGEPLAGFEEAFGVDQGFLRDLDPSLGRRGQMR